MRIIGSVTLATATLAVALTFAAAAPALAGPVCDELDLRSPCVRGNDIRANIVLGGGGDDGRLRLRNEDGATAVQLRASDANITNLFSNEADQSNGLVKAWAQINADGTIVACWRCNTDPNETRRNAAGHYEVDFTPLSTDITGRPRLAILDGHTTFTPAHGTIILADRTGDPSSVLLRIKDEAGDFADAPFVLIVY
ncbi:MAG: hypothetical protein ACREJ0_13785 [Geminicoccaceae bacterium]